MPNLSDLNETQLRDRARKLHEDQRLGLNARTRSDATNQLAAVEKELARRFEGKHPLRKLSSKLLGRLGGTAE